MKKVKKYQTTESAFNTVEEPTFNYLVTASQKGLDFSSFSNITTKIPFNQNDWSNVLHLSERTFQRYKKDKKKFEPIYAEKILEITLLFNKGIAVFADADKFYSWINHTSLALGNVKPIELMDNSFGIQMVRDELGRIEHGIFA